MLKRKFLIATLLIFSTLSLSACSSSQNEIGKCHLSDERFACHGDLSAEGSGTLIFDKSPENGTFDIAKYSLDKVDSKGDSMDFINCQGTGGEIYAGKKFTFNCQKLEPGIYYVKFYIKHIEPKNYKPLKSETCVLMKGSYGEKWHCTTYGEFKYEIANK